MPHVVDFKMRTVRYSDTGYDPEDFNPVLNTILGFDPFFPDLKSWDDIKVLFR